MENKRMLAGRRTEWICWSSRKWINNIPLDQLPNQFENLGKEQIIVFCRSGNRGQAKMIWTKWFQNVINGGTMAKRNEAIAK
jgi:rhodanese-related sulfurtransferase